MPLFCSRYLAGVLELLLWFDFLKASLRYGGDAIQSTIARMYAFVTEGVMARQKGPG